MIKLRLRTKLLLALLLITAALMCATLLTVHYRVRTQAREQLRQDLRNSLTTFQNFQQQRERQLISAAKLLADLPTLRSLMTTQHAATIQDASARFWKLAGSDILVLSDRSGRVVALHSETAALTYDSAQKAIRQSLDQGDPRDWWLGQRGLYEVFLQPIYFGKNTLLGVLAVGYGIDQRVAREVREVASSEVAFQYGSDVIVSTLTLEQQKQLARLRTGPWEGTSLPPGNIQLAGERFLATSVDLAPGTAPVRLVVLKSYDQATAFLRQMDRLLVGIGIVGIMAGTLLVFVVSHTFTRPLANLVAGVRALGRGDFSYPVEAEGKDEVAELARSFDRMRQSLEKIQAELLRSERLATIGQMASSISHDLRHQLTAILAYAEFLSEAGLDNRQRSDLYHEIRLAVDRMVDLIASLLEFSRTRESLQPANADVEETMRRAAQAVQANPEFRRIVISISTEGPTQAFFDSKKFERAIYNVLLNACEAVPPDSGHIELRSGPSAKGLEITIADNGPGIPKAIRETLFQPFVSYGKENGTGLGLAVVQKIVQDHGGEVSVENRPGGGALFRLALPLAVPSDKVPAA